MKKRVSIVLLILIVIALAVPSAMALSSRKAKTAGTYNITAKLNQQVTPPETTENFAADYYNNGQRMDNSSIDIDLSLETEDSWSARGEVLGLQKQIKLELEGNYEKMVLKNDKEIIYGYLTDTNNGIGMYIYYIPSSGKKLITLNITNGNKVATFTFGESFEEIGEVSILD